MVDYKILFLGGSGSGKSSLVKRYDTDVFDDEDYDKDFAITNVSVGSDKVPVQLCHNTSIDDLSTPNIVGIVFVFDVTSQESFEELAPIVAKMEEIIPNVAAVMCANKVEDDNSDERVVTFLGCKEIYAGKVPVFETSAKSGKNVKTVVQNLSMLAAADMAPKEEPKGDTNSDNNNSNDKACCIIQ